MAWKVPAVTDSRTPRRARRARSSPAALRVNVTARTCARGRSAASLDCHAMRRVSTRVLPEPAPARMAKRRGATGDRVALRRVETLKERVHLGTVPPGCDSHVDPRTTRTLTPRTARNSRRPRVVSAASQLGSPRGRSCRPPPILAPGLPQVLGLGVGLRFPRFPGVVPFRSFTAPDPAPIRLPGLPVRSARSHRLASSGPCFPAVPSRHRTGVHRPSQHTDARRAIASGNFARARIRCARARSVAIGVRSDGRRRARRDPRRELANELENVAVMVEDWPTPAQLARRPRGGMLLGLYEGVPLTTRGPLSYSGRRTRSHHDLPGPVCPTRPRPRRRSRRRCG